VERASSKASKASTRSLEALNIISPPNQILPLIHAIMKCAGEGDRVWFLLRYCFTAVLLLNNEMRLRRRKRVVPSSVRPNYTSSLRPHTLVAQGLYTLVA